jgi:valyl-tRNA synthetase
LEFAKPLFNGSDENLKAETRATAAWVRDQILKLLHPFMPFISEELWARTAEETVSRDSLLIEAEWPTFFAPLESFTANVEMLWLVELIKGVRSVRAEMNVPAAAKIPLVLKGAKDQTPDRLERYRDVIITLARLSSVELTDTLPKGSAQFVLGEATVGLPLGDVIDFTKERARLEKDLKKAQDEIGRIDAKLSNEQFVSKAPEDVLTEQREKRAEYAATAARLQEAVARLA